MNIVSEFYILATLSVVLIIIGLFGNIISIFVFNDKELRKQPPAFYLIVLSILNIVTLFYLPFAVLPNIWMINGMTCKFYGGMTLLIGEIQSIVTAICSLDRLITVFKPFEYLFKNKMRFQIPFVLIVSIAIAAFLVPVPYFYNQETTSDNQTFCAFSNDPQVIWALNYFKIQFILFRAIIPFLLMIVSSSLIYWKIKSNKNKLGTFNANQKKAYQLGITLIVMDILFILFRLPTLINTAINSNAADKIVYSFIYSSFVLITALHYSFSFLIFIIFNKVYRQQFLIYLKKLKSIFKKSNQVANIQ